MSAKTSFTERTPSIGRYSHCSALKAFARPTNFSFIVSRSATCTCFHDCICAWASEGAMSTSVPATTKRIDILRIRYLPVPEPN